MKKIELILLLLCLEIVGMEQARLKFPWSYSKKKSVYIPEKIMTLRAEKEVLATEVTSSKKRRIFFVKRLRVSTGLHYQDNFVRAVLDYRMGFYLYTLSFLLCEEKEFREAVKLLTQGPAINVLHNNDLGNCGLLGAIIIAKDFDHCLKSEILNYLLLNIGVKPTKKDLNLAYLEIWERTHEEWKIKKLLFRLHEKEVDGKKCCLLPRDIIKIIWQFIRTTTEAPLIPREYFKDGIVKYQD